ncbi:hypothetical protein BDW22DRAFT_1433764 [Trametopsis cervina]|nr:hypothetical protein BDW22DRAFT_1433764 [Trametopsis cervina]
MHNPISHGFTTTSDITLGQDISLQLIQMLVPSFSMDSTPALDLRLLPANVPELDWSHTSTVLPAKSDLLACKRFSVGLGKELGAYFQIGILASRVVSTSLPDLPESLYEVVAASTVHFNQVYVCIDELRTYSFEEPDDIRGMWGDKWWEYTSVPRWVEGLEPGPDHWWWSVQIRPEDYM